MFSLQNPYENLTNPYKNLMYPLCGLYVAFIEPLSDPYTMNWVILEWAEGWMPGGDKIYPGFLHLGKKLQTRKPAVIIEGVAYLFGALFIPYFTNTKRKIPVKCILIARTGNQIKWSKYLIEKVYCFLFLIGSFAIKPNLLVFV